MRQLTAVGCFLIQETPLACTTEEADEWRSKQALQADSSQLEPRTLAVSRQLFHALHTLHLGFNPILEKLKNMERHQ